MQLSTRRFVIGLAVFSGLFFALLLCFFFYNLGTTTSEYSAEGINAPHQFFYNFLHGRPFQTSLYATALTGKSVGFSHNPHAFIHLFVIHVYLTPFLFAYLWNLWPNLYWLYGLVLVVNYAGMALFAWFSLKHLSPHTFKLKAVAAIGLLLSCGFLFTFQQKAQLLLFGGPFILAANYFLLTRRRTWFVVSMVLFCLISEDAAMVAVTFSLYVFLFERNAKSYACIAGAFALIYLAAIILFVQPAARHELILTSSTTTVVVLRKILDFFPPNMSLLLISFAPVLFFLPAFGMVCLLFGKPDVSWMRIGGLALIAPLPHWGQTAVVGAVHHLAPVIIFAFVAFVLVLGKTPDSPLPARPLAGKKSALLFALLAVFLAGNMRVLASNLPDYIRLPIYRRVGKTVLAKKIEESFLDRESNRRVIEVVERIPKESSLVFLTNSNLEGFIAGRSDIWQFPDYYDSADYLVIQPKAHQSFFSFPARGASSFPESLALGKNADSNDALIPDESVREIVKYLVAEKKSHRVVVEEPGVVLLERIEKKPIYSPPSTVGLGWIHNL